jgi:hypothetical protein
MALVARAVSETVKYVSDQDPAKTTNMIPLDPNDPSKGLKPDVIIDWEKATIFHVHPLDIFLMADIYDNAQSLSGTGGSSEVAIHTKVNKTNVDAVRFGLSKLENFYDKDGKAVLLQFEEDTRNGRKYQVLTDATMDRLGLMVITDVANEIKRISEVTSEQANFSVRALSQ